MLISDKSVKLSNYFTVPYYNIYVLFRKAIFATELSINEFHRLIIIKLIYDDR